MFFWLIFNRDTWNEIFDSIRKNKMRTAITVSGVLWGIFIYITLSGAARGMDNGFEREFKGVAMNSMFIWTEPTTIPYGGYKIGRSFRLQLSDIPVLKARVPTIQYIAPRNVKGMWGTPPAKIVNGQKSGQYNIYGDYPEFVKIFSKKIYDGGRFINALDISETRKVCVIGERTKKELFGKNENPVGHFLEIDGSYFQVIGVHKFEPGGGMESDGDVYIPFTTYKKLYNSGENVGWYAIAAYDTADVIQVEKDIKRILKNIYSVSPKDERAIGSFNLGEMFGRIMGFSRGMTLLSLIVGVATIFAGVIGIGNILLISVKERTNELGIRRALGATPAEVRAHIILESVFLTLLAGVLGIVLGALALSGIDSATQNIEFPYTNPTVPISYVLGSLILMVGLGTLIGLIPAQRAVSIRPIDALREE
jgi:putative ABC transport system permease protein